MMTAPDRHRIIDGELVLADGTPSKEALQAWQKKMGHPDGTPVNVIARADFQKLVDEITFLKNLTLCA